MSLRAWISWITIALVVIIVIASRDELLHAWRLLETVNVAILLLLIPLQLIAYYAAGETIFSYLRSKHSIGEVSRFELTRMALELNFVNHTLPSGGVSGISYLSWRLGKYGVSAGRATIAQVVRFVAGFGAAIVLIFISVLIVTIDGNINRWIILVSASIVTFMTLGTIGMVFLVSSKRRMELFSAWLAKHVNRLVRRVSKGRKRNGLNEQKLLVFFNDMHDDYLSLRKDVRILLRPFLWALLFTLAEAALFWTTFWALGTPVNPAPIVIAYCLASVAGFIVVTPGGTGAYEAIMVGFLAVAGIASGTAIAGIVLTRVIVLLTTIVLGYVFYQRALLKYGKKDKPPLQR